MKLTNEFNSIINWADERGILNNATVDTQFIKLQEEIGELAISILKKDESLFKDSIGDCVVVLTILAKLKNMSIEDCINSAYDEIKNRKGKMINGVFTKQNEIENNLSC